MTLGFITSLSFDEKNMCILEFYVEKESVFNAYLNIQKIIQKEFNIVHTNMCYLNLQDKSSNDSLNNQKPHRILLRLSSKFQLKHLSLIKALLVREMEKKCFPIIKEEHNCVEKLLLAIKQSYKNIGSKNLEIYKHV